MGMGPIKKYPSEGLFVESMVKPGNVEGSVNCWAVTGIEDRKVITNAQKIIFFIEAMVPNLITTYFSITSIQSYKSKAMNYRLNM